MQQPRCHCARQCSVLLCCHLCCTPQMVLFPGDASPSKKHPPGTYKQSTQLAIILYQHDSLAAYSCERVAKLANQADLAWHQQVLDQQVELQGNFKANLAAIIRLSPPTASGPHQEPFAHLVYTRRRCCTKQLWRLHRMPPVSPQLLPALELRTAERGGKRSELPAKPRSFAYLCCGWLIEAHLLSVVNRLLTVEGIHRLWKGCPCISSFWESSFTEGLISNATRMGISSLA